ncbi:MAG: hypothetical protein ACQEXJ_12390 [Myxococcota bacterium]
MSWLGEEVLDWWMPREDLTLQDILPSEQPWEPEQVVADAEARKVLTSALLQLPREMRRDFSNVVIDGLEPWELADAVGVDPRAIEDRVRAASDRLSRVISAEPVDVGTVTHLYRALGTRIHQLADNEPAGEPEPTQVDVTEGSPDVDHPKGD